MSWGPERWTEKLTFGKGVPAGSIAAPFPPYTLSPDPLLECFPLRSPDKRIQDTLPFRRAAEGVQQSQGEARKVVQQGGWGGRGEERIRQRGQMRCRCELHDLFLGIARYRCAAGFGVRSRRGRAQDGSWRFAVWICLRIHVNVHSHRLDDGLLDVTLHPFPPPFSHTAQHRTDHPDPVRSARQAVPSKHSARDAKGDQIGEEVRFAELGDEAPGVQQVPICSTQG